jgi:hypothetical protein
MFGQIGTVLRTGGVHRSKRVTATYFTTGSVDETRERPDEFQAKLLWRRATGDGQVECRRRQTLGSVRCVLAVTPRSQMCRWDRARSSHPGFRVDRNETAVLLERCLTRLTNQKHAFFGVDFS